MTIDHAAVWFVIVALAVGSFTLRFLFLGLIGDRAMPDWILRHLRYTAVAILPGLVAPMVLWPQATQGETDPHRLFAAAVALVAGLWCKQILPAIVAGSVALAGATYWF
jgi:branched-subunit amino acid transport protein